MFLFCLNLGISAQTPFQQANAAYDAGQYKRAIEQYNSMLEDGYKTAAIYYNLGNAWYQLGDMGQAALQYERALQLAPEDEAIHHNLRLILRLTNPEIEQLPQFFLRAWWQAFRNGMHSKNWAIAGIAFCWIAAAIFLWQWLFAQPRKKRWLSAGIIAGILCLLFLITAYAKFNSEVYSDTVVLMDDTAPLRSAPEENALVETELYAGISLTVEDQIGDWYKVRLPDGHVGWIDTIAVERV